MALKVMHSPMSKLNLTNVGNDHGHILINW